MDLKCISVIALMTLAVPAFAAPTKQIELLAESSPYLQIETLSQKLAAAEKKLADLPPKKTLDVLAENPEISSAASDGWEPVYFKGIGDVLIKQAGTRSIIKMPSGKAQEGQIAMAAAMKAMFRCDSSTCFVLDSASLATKQKSREGK